MTTLETTDPDIYKEFLNGNLSVNKNKITVCVLGVDHVLEPQNSHYEGHRR